MTTTTFTKGIEEYEENVTFGTGITGTGLVHSFGTRKIQTFVGSLADTDTSTQYADGDVLVELGGYTAHNRMAVLVHKPAKIQLSYLGYCAPTYLDCIDGWIGDETLFVPLDSDNRHYAEILKQVEAGTLTIEEAD